MTTPAPTNPVATPPKLAKEHAMQDMHPTTRPKLGITKYVAVLLTCFALLLAACGGSSETTTSEYSGSELTLPVAFVAKINAADGQADDLSDLLAGAVSLANEEEGTIVWFAAQTDDSTFWVFDAFPGGAARDAHANGAIVEALLANAQLLDGPPEILPADVLAMKLP